MTATIIRADARAIPLPDASVDLIVTSPPYFALRSYQDAGEHYAGQIGAEPTPQEYIASLIDCTREWMRVLKPSGSIFVNLGDKYAGNVGTTSGHRGNRQTKLNGWSADRQESFNRANQPQSNRTGVPSKSLMLLPERYRIAAVDQLGLIARAVLVWSKPNGLPESATDRVRRSHEDWVHLTRAPRYYSAVDEIRQPSNPRNLRPADVRGSISAKEAARRDAGHGTVGHVGKPLTFNPLGKLPGSVWEIVSEPLRVPDHLGVDHFAAFPTEWPRRLILGWSPVGGLVLDPFGGTGTTALVAHALGRHGISVDRSADYCRLGRWRTTDPSQIAKAMRVAAPPVEATGQAPLFDEVSR